jgi:SSS family solute:Na+ symporter
MLGLFLLGLIARRAGNAAAAAGVSVGVLLIFWMTFSPQWTGALAAWQSPFHTFLIVVISTLAIFLVGLFVSQLAKRPLAGPGEPVPVKK